MITNLHNGKRYVGQSRNIFARWKQHTQSLPTESPCSLIQKAFNKYGLTKQVSKPGTYNQFKFEVLKECPEEDLLDVEIKYIKKLKPEYNIALMPPNEDLTALRPKDEIRLIVQYHSMAKEGHFPGLPEDPIFFNEIPFEEMKHWISTRKRMACNSKGDYVSLILGYPGQGGTDYYLWSTTIIEEITWLPTEEELPINLSGEQWFYYPFLKLNNLVGFQDFKKRMGNFAYGFQTVKKEDGFFETLINLIADSPQPLFEVKTQSGKKGVFTSLHYIVSFMKEFYPDEISD
jgi:group I intron endonuclease